MKPSAFGATVVTSRPADVTAFYQRYFDLQISVDTGWFICLRRDGADWEIAICERGHSAVPAAVSAALASTNVFGFVVDDVDKIARLLIEGGVELEGEIVDEAWGQRHFFLRDPEGTWIDVIQLTTLDPEWLANLPA